MECPTVRIKATTGSYPFTTINETDFDPAKHERYVEGDALTAAKAKEEADAKAKALSDAAKMNKVDLLLYCQGQGKEVSDSMTKAELLELLK